jgi:hypothetical protein
VAVVTAALVLFLAVGPISVPGVWSALLVGAAAFGATYLAVTAALERYINARLRMKWTPMS